MLNPETEMMNPATQARLPSARLLKRPLRLLIAIPAYNEEESIESIVERCLEAKEKIISESPVTDVEITVVAMARWTAPWSSPNNTAGKST